MSTVRTDPQKTLINGIEYEFVPAEVVDIDYQGTNKSRLYTVTCKIMGALGSVAGMDVVNARAMDANIKNLPIIGEVVMITKAPTPYANAFSSIKEYYYSHPISIQSSVHHNGLPGATLTSPIIGTKNKNVRTNAEDGLPYDVTEGVEYGGGSMDVGFPERLDVFPLQPYSGDILIEGRWGQSIRFGSTVTGSNNTWSSTGTNGDPILIIRNGQYNDKKEAWYPIVEDINLDSGSVYFGTTQKIPLDASSVNYESYDTPPTTPKEYSYSQIIINSGRLVLNSYEDHILLTSKKSVGLNAIESVNIDSPKTIIQSSQVYLGGKEATEPVLLGDRTYDILKVLINDLNSLAQSLSTQVGVPPGSPLEPTATIARSILSNTNALKTEVEKIKSTISKTL